MSGCSPGGQFEFLPITLVSEAAVLTGVICFGLKAGLELSTGATSNPLQAIVSGVFPVSAGIVAQVFADDAEFVTYVTNSGNLPSNASDVGTSPCAISQSSRFINSPSVPPQIPPSPLATRYRARHLIPLSLYSTPLSPRPTLLSAAALHPSPQPR